MSRQHDYHKSLLVTASRGPLCAAAASPRRLQYTHNPYATAKLAPAMPMQMSGEPAQGMQMSGEGSTGRRGTELAEQFAAAAGTFAVAAQSAAGRQMLTSVLRLQSAESARAIADELAPELNAVALDVQGCHVVRTLFEVLPTDHAVALAQRLLPETLVRLAIGSQHTRRVLQVLFERHRGEALTPIVAVIAQHSHALAVAQQGCIAVIRIIENALPHQQGTVIAALLPILPMLTMDRYGNYVVQCILQHMDHCALVSVVCNAFAGHWVELSRNKFASNVVEKVVWQLDGNARGALVAELVLDTQNLKCLMKDGFGNFVLQAIIQSSKDANEFQEISSRVQPLLQTSPYGHKIESKLHGGIFRPMRMAPT